MEYRKSPQGYVVRLDPGEEIVERLTSWWTGRGSSWAASPPWAPPTT